jgi:hypothetical protein
MQYKMSLKQAILLYSIVGDIEADSSLEDFYKSLEKYLLDYGVDLGLANNVTESVHLDNGETITNLMKIDYKKLSECL